MLVILLKKEEKVNIIKEAMLSNGNVNITTDEIIFPANSPMTKDDYILKKGHGKIFYYDIKNGLYVEKV